MVILGIILLVLGLFGIARPLLIPLGAIMLTIGLIWDILYFVGHGVALIF
jgi:hypothetical protein